MACLPCALALLGEQAAPVAPDLRTWLKNNQWIIVGGLGVAAVITYFVLTLAEPCSEYYRKWERASDPFWVRYWKDEGRKSECPWVKEV